MDLTEIIQQAADDTSIPLISAFLLGLLAAISPCPLATNITAMAYISREVNRPGYVVISGILYTLGRMASYFSIGAAIILAGTQTHHISDFLQDTGEYIIGPLLLIVGIIMLDLVKLPLDFGGGKLSALGAKVTNRGLLGAFLLGVIFALAFCPYTAILFFIVMIPMALESTEGIILPASFAVGSGLPVLIFAAMLSTGISKVSQLMDKVTATEKVIRIITALVFIGVGTYYVILWIGS